jgi:hypothetical protein
MASEKFNTLKGLTVGIPPVTVIDQTGNVVSNFNNPAGNVTANLVFASDYRLPNGSPFVGNLNSVTSAGSLTDDDQLIILQAGVPKKVSLLTLKNYLGL